jgi:hypothetical protein
MQINEDVYMKKSTVGTLRSVDCLLKAHPGLIMQWHERRRILELSVGQYIIKQNISKIKYFTRKKLSEKK